MSVIPSKCPDWSVGEAPTYPSKGQLRWVCAKCGAERECPDNGKGRQQAVCVCGQCTILLDASREGWLD